MMAFPFFSKRNFYAAVAALLAIVGFHSPSSSARIRIIDGSLTTSAEFPEVFALYYATESIKGRVELCTGTLIHPKIILTSAHCVPEDPTVVVTVNEGLSVRQPTRQLKAVSSVRHEVYSYTQDAVLQTGFDFGIVVLENAVEGIVPARLASIETLASRQALLRSASLEVVGYGGSRKVGADQTTGLQRKGQTRAVEALDKQFSTEGPVSALSIGDSGGPAFLPEATLPRTLVGVASGVPAENIFLRDGRPTVSLYASMRPAIAKWIEEESGMSLGYGIEEMKTPPVVKPATTRADPLDGFGEPRE